MPERDGRRAAGLNVLGAGCGYGWPPAGGSEVTGGFFPAAEKLAETVKLFGGDAVEAVGDIVMKFL